MALVAGRIACGARASQPSVSCGSLALDMDYTHSAERLEGSKVLRPVGVAQRQSGPLGEDRFQPLREKIAHHRRERSEQYINIKKPFHGRSMAMR